MGNYLRVADINEALAALADTPCTVIAGGTDFYPARVGKPLAEPVLDISGLSTLRGIIETDDGYRIGALTTWTDLLRAKLPPLFDGLKRAARGIGGIQIQNAGTLCGNICNASPAADGVPNLLVLDARVELSSAGARRVLALGDFITGNRRTERRTDELLTALLIPKPKADARSTFLKLGARRYLVISIVMVAAVAILDEDNTLQQARIAVGACSAVAQRLSALEQALTGAPLTATLADRVVEAHLAALSPIDDMRATAVYRHQAALTLVRRALAELAEPNS